MQVRDFYLIFECAFNINKQFFRFIESNKQQMNQENLFKKIGSILNELNAQYESLGQNPQQLNELELDLFHANADFLSDHAQILIKISKNAEGPLQGRTVTKAPETDLEINDRREELEQEYYGDSLQVAQQVEEITFAEEPSEIFKLDQTPSSFEFILSDSLETNRSIEENDKFEFEGKSVDELFDRPLSQEEENILAQKRKLSETNVEIPLDNDDDEIGPEPFLVSKDDLTIIEGPEPLINDKPVAIEDPSYKPTLNDLLATKSDKSVNDHSGTNRISDLKQGVNLNDKLLYIKDLFNGYNLAYAEAIDLANKLPNFEAADDFFKKNYAVKNNWVDKQATVDKFYALLNQRFKG